MEIVFREKHACLSCGHEASRHSLPFLPALPSELTAGARRPQSLPAWAAGGSVAWCGHESADGAPCPLPSAGVCSVLVHLNVETGPLEGELWEQRDCSPRFHKHRDVLG